MEVFETYSLEALRHRRTSRGYDLTEVVEDVVVVAMPARSGSSWLIETLKQSLEAVHFTGELTPFLRLNGLAIPTRGNNSEALGAASGSSASKQLRVDLSSEAGWPANRIEDQEEFLDDVMFRLHLQWPASNVQNDQVAAIVKDHIQIHAASYDADAFTRAVVKQVSKITNIDIDFYDFGKEPRRYPGALPWSTMLESPPFVKFQPWQRAKPEEFAGRPLIIKSAGDIHRLSFYKALFPKARFRVIHLARNPAGTINGLMDGWMSTKYHSFKVGGLSIDGYSDLDDSWRSDWWKFDLAPGWEVVRNKSLAEVCAWQWVTSEEAIQSWISEHHPPFFTLHYESLIGSKEEAVKTIADLCNWLGISQALSATEKVMNASHPPKKYRWRGREDEILPIVTSPQILKLAARLGYSSNVELWP